jgi:hypothetical protein
MLLVSQDNVSVLVHGITNNNSGISQKSLRIQILLDFT